MKNKSHGKYPKEEEKKPLNIIKQFLKKKDYFIFFGLKKIYK